MASIFLSYARDDAAKAERIAHLLEAHGHSVWWDRHLHTGARFTAEIDEALRAAEAIVVLWSTASVGSAWVQDEAAVGRDRGRLFPVLLETVSPPLGFRQFQASDLSGWSGRGRPRALSQLANMIGPQTSAKVAGASLRPTTSLRRPRAWTWAGIGALLIVLGTIGFVTLRGSDSSPVLTIVAAKTDQTSASRDFAHQVALDLDRFRPASLSSIAVLEGDRHANYRAEIALDRSGKREAAEITLTMAGRPGLTWANRIEGQSNQVTDLRQQAAAVLSAVIRCAIEAQASRARLQDSDLRLFLNGCTIVSTDLWQATGPDLIPTFKRITQSSPDFAPAQAMLALAYTNAFDQTSSAEKPAMLRDMRAALAKAKAIDPNSEDVIAVDSVMHSSDPKQWDHIFPILDRGLAAHPISSLLLGFRSQALMTIGRMNEAASVGRQALQQDPLAPQIRTNLIDALAYSGLIDRARQELAQAEAIWPRSTMLEDARYRLDLRYGDPKSALRLLGTRFGGSDLSGPGFDQSWQAFLQARINPTPANIDAALNSFRGRYRRDPGDIPGYIQALGTFGQADEAFQITRNPLTLDSMEASTDTLFRPHMRSLYSDPRFIDLANRLGLLAYWRKSGAWPDFCSDPTLPYDCQKEAAKYR